MLDSPCFQICAGEVYFWDNLPHELELMHEQKMYPPRFTLQVCGEKATHDATAVVEFEGACEDLSTEIHLSLPTTGTHKLFYIYYSMSMEKSQLFSSYAIDLTPFTCNANLGEYILLLLL